MHFDPLFLNFMQFKIMIRSGYKIIYDSCHKFSESTSVIWATIVSIGSSLELKFSSPPRFI